MKYNPIDMYTDYVVAEAAKNKEKRAKENTGYLEASQAGMCYKKHWYRQQNQEPKPFVKSSLKIMRLGTVMGDEFDKGPRHWIEQQDTDVELYSEVLMKSETLNVAGHMDLLIVEPDGKGYLWDWKTANSFKYKMIFNANGAGSPSVNYELQVATYGLLAIENGLCKTIEHLGLIYYNKDNSSMKEKIVDLNYMEKARKYWLDIPVVEPNYGMGKVPVYKWECGKYCNYSHVCGSPFLTKEVR